MKAELLVVGPNNVSCLDSKDGAAKNHTSSMFLAVPTQCSSCRPGRMPGGASMKVTGIGSSSSSFEVCVFHEGRYAPPQI